jgi:hypothetical protein
MSPPSKSIWANGTKISSGHWPRIQQTSHDFYYDKNVDILFKVLEHSKTKDCKAK